MTGVRSNNAAQVRPDGRSGPDDVLRLRRATRALRQHLDTLPIDFNLGALPYRFLTGLAFVSARNRYDYVESLIGAGFGGTAMGAISRGLLVDALRWEWISSDPKRVKSLEAELLRERDRICNLLAETQATCPILNRWLQPLPAVAGLTGQAQAWERLDPVPSDERLLASFLAAHESAAGERSSPWSALQARVRTLLSRAELHGSSMVLAHSGHGNYLGLLSSVAEDGSVGFDLRFDHEALFMQAAAIGVVTTLIGSLIADSAWWPREVPVEPFAEKALDLASEVSKAAAAVHGIVGRQGSRTLRSANSSRPAEPFVPNVAATLTTSSLLPDLSSTAEVWRVAEQFFALLDKLAVDPWADGQPFHAVVSYGSALSNLQAIFSSSDQLGAQIVLPFVARMLLEEAGRTAWRYSVPTPSVFEAQATQYFDEYRARRKKTIDQLVTSGVPRATAERFFELPSFVDVTRVPKFAAKGRTPLPPVSVMLDKLGDMFSEPGWLQVAYSLLSQMTHTTALGLLHSVRFGRGHLRGGELSSEMTALSLDIACVAGARILGTAGLILRNLDDDARQWRDELLRGAARVHDAARMVHGLD